ncbi:putative transcription factor [Cryptosporidium canis]|uniref:Transcription factor n=1 Tax=Cryptosporidium canis TaxID=195482 RepID=A0ABQ8P8R1_9CRYT|nr:putative transcription factor [Cryptosporidium canis]
MEGTLYLIIDSRSLFRQDGEGDGQVGVQSSLLVSGECVFNSLIQFTRLYNLSGGQKKRLDMYVCDSGGGTLLFSGFISEITREVQQESLPRVLGEMGDKVGLGEMKMSPTISKCLCRINGVRKRFGHAKSDNDRIILVDASNKDDYISQYVSLLNCGFASQKLGTPIDVVSVTRSPSPLLNNLVDICKGLNLRYSQMADSLLEGGGEMRDGGRELEQGLTPFLIFHLLPSLQAREETFVSLNRTKQTGLAVCFCHHEKIDIGYVCSSCLSIFCSRFRAPICSTCGARLKRVPIQQKTLSSLNIEDGRNIY